VLLLVVAGRSISKMTLGFQAIVGMLCGGGGTVGFYMLGSCGALLYRSLSLPQLAAIRCYSSHASDHLPEQRPPQLKNAYHQTKRFWNYFIAIVLQLELFIVFWVMYMFVHALHIISRAESSVRCWSFYQDNLGLISVGTSSWCVCFI
jgi:hypothetical protein